MTDQKCRWFRFVVTFSVFVFCTTVARASEYNAGHCQLILGTLNIHWEHIAGLGAPCAGIELTDGTLADAADGTISMKGVSVVSPGCNLGTATYNLALSSDRATLSGFETTNNVPMTLTRGPGESCFVGHWTSGDYDYIAHIAAAPFLGGVPAPALGGAGVLFLGLALLGAGAMRCSRHAAAASATARSSEHLR